MNIHFDAAVIMAWSLGKYPQNSECVLLNSCHAQIHPCLKYWWLVFLECSVSVSPKKCVNCRMYSNNEWNIDPLLHTGMKAFVIWLGNNRCKWLKMLEITTICVNKRNMDPALYEAFKERILISNVNENIGYTTWIENRIAFVSIMLAIFGSLYL